MLTIGLTGGIGAGKTEVANLFAKLGVPIIDADLLARQVSNEPAILEQLREHFGAQIIRADGSLDRKQLRTIIFNDATERMWLEKTLHPPIRLAIEKQIQTLKTEPYCIVVIPLLIETARYPFLNRILVVDADQHLQIARVQQRDQVSAAHIQAILEAQTSRETRLSHAHDIILNDSSLNDLAQKVQKLHHFYLDLSKRS